MTIQTRICSYYKSQCKHIRSTPITFLSLPGNIRDRIYAWAGVVTGASIRIWGREMPEKIAYPIDGHWPWYIPLVFCTRESPHGVTFYCSGIGDKRLPAESEAIYYNLSISNSTINTDIARFVYSHNRIILCCDDYFTTLDVLLHLPSSWVRSFPCLTIHLKAPDGDRESRSNRHCNHRGDFPPAFIVKPTSPNFRPLIQLWYATLKSLAQSTLQNVSKLHLNILCDMGGDVLVAQRLMLILAESGLATNTIRLGHKPSEKFRTMARNTVLQTNALKDPPFRFLDLPVELRQHILSFTDLITPRREVSWHSECGKFYFKRNPEDRPWWSQNNEFCAHDYAVYPHCGCWEPPISLFLVCKAILQNAKVVFYATNRFIIDVNFRKSIWSTVSVLSEDANFLTKMIPDKDLSYLRNLEIRFTSTCYEFSSTDKAAYESWIRNIEYLAPLLKKLTLRLYMMLGEADYPRRGPDLGRTQEELEARFSVHEEIVRPLARITSLEHCFVRAMTPFHTEAFCKDLTRKQRLFNHERHLEMLAMGRKYDSIAAGKLEQQESAWLHAYQSPPM